MKNNSESSKQSPHLLKGRKKPSSWLTIPFVVLFALFGAIIVWKSFAASTPAADSNDIISGGFSASSTAAARSSVISRMNTGNAGAKELFAAYGITEKEINAATLVGGFDPRNSSYSNWFSFGRNNRGQAGTQAVHVGTFTFYAKPVRNAWTSTTKRTGPVLKGVTKDGRSFVLHSECGNLAIPTLTQYKPKPNAKITKAAVTPSTSTKVKPGDVITYRITATNTGDTVDYIKIADTVPKGTSFVSESVETKNAFRLDDETKNGIKYMMWGNGSLNPGGVIRIQLKVKVDTNTKTSFCNAALITWVKGQTLPGKSNNVCHSVRVTITTPPPPPPVQPPPPPPVLNPAIDITKTAVSPAAGSKVRIGDTISYKVTVKNTGEGKADNVVVNDPFPQHSRGGVIDRHTESTGANGFKDTSSGSAFSWTYTSLASGAQGDVYFKVTVQDGKSGDTVCNVATVTSTPTDTSQQICHNISDLELSKSAVFLNRTGSDGKPLVANETTVAKAGDEIEYTLITKNTGSSPLTDYVVLEHLDDVLEYADITDQEGGTFITADQTLSWKVTIPAGESFTNRFKVKVKNPIPDLQPKPTNPGSYDYKMFNTYGNDVTIPVEKTVAQVITTVINQLPDTGAIGLFMLPLILLAGLALAYSSGLVGGKRAVANNVPTHHEQVATHSHESVTHEPTHKPGDTFEPEDDKQA